MNALPVLVFVLFVLFVTLAAWSADSWVEVVQFSLAVLVFVAVVAYATLVHDTECVTVTTEERQDAGTHEEGVSLLVEEEKPSLPPPTPPAAPLDKSRSQLPQSSGSRNINAIL